MPTTQPAAVAIAVVRIVIEPGRRAAIRILEVADLFREEHVLGVTTSADEAGRIVSSWLTGVIERGEGEAVDSPESR